MRIKLKVNKWWFYIDNFSVSKVIKITNEYKKYNVPYQIIYESGE